MINAEALIEEFYNERKNIKTDTYSMSIGEVINLYKEGDLILNPAFQRLFRWDDEQKTSFIESILIGIPIPEIFVAQKEDGTWSIVDGVQRMSTILQLTGDLIGKEPLKLTTSKYLPSLEDFYWQELPKELQRIFRRSKIGISIILTENSIEAQYELFQRLNTGGLHLEDQEIRNCLIIMLSSEFYEKINELKNFKGFKKCLQVKKETFDKEYHMELILRYLIAKYGNVNYSQYNVSNVHLRTFIDRETIRILEDEDFDLDKEIEIFKKTFTFLSETLGKDIFRKYNADKKKFNGAFLISCFEAIASGVAENLDKLKSLDPGDFIDLIEQLYSEPIFIQYTRRGVKALSRFKGLTEFSRDYFSK